jgi:2-oxoglutarate ferredoxin oxidoreductase subunit delta
MAIAGINYEACTGCNECVDICSMDVIRIDSVTGKVIIKYPEDCMCCYMCEIKCPGEAITVSPYKRRRILLPWDIET